jgi:hypothetical protein
VSTNKRAGKKTRQGKASASGRPPHARTTGPEHELDDRDLDKVSGGTGTSRTGSPATDSSLIGSWEHEQEFRSGKWTNADHEFELPTKTSSSR